MVPYTPAASVLIYQSNTKEEEEDGTERSLFKADAVNEEDAEHDRATQV